MSVNLSKSQVLVGISEIDAVGVDPEKFKLATKFQHLADLALLGAVSFLLLLYVYIEFFGTWNFTFKVSVFLGCGIFFATLVAWTLVNSEFTKNFRAKYVLEGMSPRNARTFYYRKYPFHFLPHMMVRHSLVCDTEWVFNG